MDRYFLPPLLACTLAMQGCATPPSEIRELREYGRVEINQPYAQAATCLSQDMDSTAADGVPKKRMKHTLHTYPEAGYAEIIGSQRSDGTYVVAVRPSGSGHATATTYVSSTTTSPNDIAGEIGKSAARCSR